MGHEDLITPAERRRLKVRESILEAAEHAFASEGQEGVSIRRLAEAIDYSPAAIYKYFGSKEELLDELKEAFFSRILEKVSQIGEASKPFPQQARACVATYVRTAIEKPHHYVAAFGGQTVEDALDVNDPGFEDTRKGEAFVFLQGMVQEGIDLGVFRDELRADLAAKSLWASMHGLAMMMAHMPNFPDFGPPTSGFLQDEFIDFHADLAIRGLEVS